MEPVNPAAQMIVSAQSVITDLTMQAAEIQSAITRQQALIDSLVPVAVWTEPPVEEPVPEDPQVDEPALEDPPVEEPDPSPAE